MAELSGEFQDAKAALEGLDRLLQHQGRLGICVLLAGVDCMSFSRLKQLLGQTDGNLGAQLRKLENASYVAVRKEFVNRKPVSWYTLTRAGRDALNNHLAAMESIIRSTKADLKRPGLRR